MRFFSLFFFTYLFATNGFLIRPYIPVNTTNPNYPLELNLTITEDEKNRFFYKDHFRVIVGKNYDNDIVYKILEIANLVWQKEINEFNFKPPKNSNKYYIDIYLANTNAYNPQIGELNLSQDYCGYTFEYNNSTPYFVINPNIDLNIIKITIAHEFFHTIQYAYGLDDVNMTIWNKNRWFLEASAVMVEDEVFDDINDYINFLDYYIFNLNLPLEYSNGVIEYGKVLFAKFLKIDLIKKIFQNYNKNETILQTIKKLTNFDELMINYGVCLADIHNCYRDGGLFTSPPIYPLNINKYVGEYGIVLFKDDKNYLITKNPYYLQSNFLGESNILQNIQTGLVFIAKKNISTDILKYNTFNGYHLKKGWNLIANIFNNNIDFKEFDAKFVWVFRNNKYCGYSNNQNILQEIKTLGYECEEEYIKPNEGAWVYVEDDKNISINEDSLAKETNYTLRGFNFAIYTKDIEINNSIWFYDNNWFYYSDKNFSYPKLDKITPSKGYFVIQGF